MIEKNVVPLLAFSMVGYIVPAREALGLIRKVVAGGLSTFDF